jgi:hypothetical protein
VDDSGPQPLSYRLNNKLFEKTFDRHGPGYIELSSSQLRLGIVFLRPLRRGPRYRKGSAQETASKGMNGHDRDVILTENSPPPGHAPSTKGISL